MRIAFLVLVNSSKYVYMKIFRETIRNLSHGTILTLSITLINPWPGFQCGDIFQHWISHKRHAIET